MVIKEYKTINQREILELYSSVGWTAYTDSPETLYAGLAKSLLLLTAYENGSLLGLIRCVGDGETIVYIQDILVKPDHQRRGIGTALLNEALRRFPHVRQIVLSTDIEDRTLAFYRSLGFESLEKLGCRAFMLIK